MKLTAKLLLRHMAKGGKIRRKAWQQGMYLRKATPKAESCAFLFMNYNQKGEELWVPGIKSLVATDWEKIR